MLITNIQRFSLDDGPGIRTTIFLAGCNMRCLWCHNPETFDQVMLEYDADKCVGCMRCKEVCLAGVHEFTDKGHEIRWGRCNKCLKCLEGCTNGAIFCNSREITVEDILLEIEKDRHFYEKSSGGVTISGGEPILQGQELKELLLQCKKKQIQTAIETAGNYSFSLLEELLEFIDLVMIDCKAYSEELHIECTGKSNKQILINIQRLCDIQKRIWVRIPIVWNVNITLDEMDRIAEFLEGNQIEKVELLPYHKMGIAKYKTCGLKYPISSIETPTEKQLKQCYQILNRHNLPM